MTFLNAALAFGAAAFAVPLIIHILNRSRFKTVDWGAMHLLESVIKVNHKRFQIEQWILLMIRCALPVLLALCLARPVFTGFQALQGNAPVSLAIVLDNSYSMDAIDSDGSRYEQAIAAASDIIAATTRGSEIAVIQTGGKPTPLFDQPTFDAETAIRKLNKQQPGFGASDMPAAIDEAVATLAGMSNARRELFIISDFQPADWETIGRSPEAVTGQLEASSIVPEVSLLSIGSKFRENVSVDGLDFTSRPLGEGQTLNIRAMLRNHSESPVESARVIFRVDNKEETVSTVSLSANGTSQVLFPHRFDNAGSHVVEVQVLNDDALPTDNKYRAAVNIWDDLKILLVDGDPSNEPLQSETDYLAVAMTPFAFGRIPLADLIQTETVRSNDLNEDRLKETRLVVLANVSKLNDEQHKQLEEYVRGGGALFVTAGDRVDLPWYKNQLFNAGQGLLPSPFTESRGQVDGQGSSSRIVSQRFEHPALEYFNDASHGDLSTAEIQRWYAVDEPDESVRIAASLNNGDPLLLEKDFGDGVVMQMTTTCDAEWNDLPVRPVYLPFVQQLATTLASRIAPPRNIGTGEPAVALLHDVSTPVAITVEAPDGRQRVVETTPQGKLQVARFDDTQRPGIYTMTLTGGRPIHFAAETGRSESNPDVLASEDVDKLATALGGTRVESADAYLEQDRLRRHGREIWKLLLAGFLAFLMLELILQQRFARVTT